MTKQSTRAWRLAFLIFVVVAGSCSSPAPESPAAQSAAADQETVRAVVAGIISADNERNLESVMSFYEDDAVLLPPGESPVYGKRYIRPRYQSLFESSRLKMFPTSEETIVSGDWAFDQGYIQGNVVTQEKDAETTRVVDDQYLMILHKQSAGSWKIAKLMWHPRQKTDEAANKSE